MKLLTMQKAGQFSLGVLTDKGVLDVAKAAEALDKKVAVTMEDLIKGGPAALQELAQLVKEAESKGDAVLEDIASIQFGPCVTNPEKIMCIGLNYKKHAIETNLPMPSTPVLFSKFNNALAGHKQVIPLPAQAEMFDYEAELVIVMGKETRNVSEQDALSHVFGYTVGNDLSARDLQFRTPQWLLGKTCDGFGPVGPYIVTSDEAGDPDNLNIECRVNGEVRQSSNTRDMIFSCRYIISYLSQTMTLKPGDIIFTGTPSGVITGYPDDKRVWLKSGDEVTVVIENLGELTNTLA